VVLYPEKLNFGWTKFRGAGQNEQKLSSLVGRNVRAVSQQHGDVKLIIDYGHEETATIGLWQAVKN
jgi:hypothetical protein